MTPLRPLHILLSGFATLALATTPLHAQPPGVALLLEATDTDTAALPPHAAARAARAGRVNPAAFAAGRVLVTLPDGRTLAAERRQEERGSRGEQVWVGEFEDAPGSLLVVTRHRGVVTGFLHHEAETYELGVAADGRTLLFEVNEAQLPDEGEPIGVVGDSPEDALMQAELAESATATDLIVQDLLVVYTAKAVTRAGTAATLESKIINAVAAANAAYASSAVNIRLNLVGLEPITYAETGDMSLTLSRLRGTSDGYMDGVHTRRNALGADLVALVSDDSNYCGIAYVMSTVSASFASSAFSVVFQDCFSNQTFAHEIGHNQGNAHDRANGGSNAYPYAFGYRTCDNVAFTNGQSFRTVMAYACSGTPRVNAFSNPDVFYNGAPMGVAHTATTTSTSADNARAMNNTAATTAAFRASTTTATAPAAPSGLTVAGTTATSVSLTWADQSSDESGFTLERAVGGGSFATRATLASNTASFVDTGLVAGTTYHYRVRAFNAAGTSAWSTTASATTPAAITSAPASPTPAALTLSGTTALVTWTNVANESSYRVVRETYNAKKKTWASTTTTVGADVTSLTQSLAKGTYRYRVSAVNAAGSSAAAVVTCATCGSDGSFTIGSTSTSRDNGKK